MPITPLPPAPSTEDFENFDLEADAMLGQLDLFVEEANALEENVNAKEAAAGIHASSAAAAATAALEVSTSVAQSNSPMSMSAGTKAVTLVQNDRNLQNGRQMVAIRRSDNSIRLIGEIQDWDGQSFDFVVPPNGVVGAGGPYSDWDFLPTTYFSLAATKEAALEALAADVALTPLVVREMLEPFALTDGNPVLGLSGLNGLDFTWTLTASRTLPQLTNTYRGASGSITAKQDAVGGRVLAVHTSWKRRGGLGVLSTAANAEDEIEYKVKAVDGAGNATKVVYDVIKAPT
jgi:hypothetical protein